MFKNYDKKIKELEDAIEERKKYLEQTNEVLRKFIELMGYDVNQKKEVVESWMFGDTIITVPVFTKIKPVKKEKVVKKKTKTKKNK